LLRETLDRVFADGAIQRVELDVFSNNEAAIRLYRRAGFAIEGRKRRGRILDGVEEDVVVMSLLRDEWADR
jgi:RimJ/RimL family protein N-acetyltransferase